MDIIDKLSVFKLLLPAVSEKLVWDVCVCVCVCVYTCRYWEWAWL